MRALPTTLLVSIAALGASAANVHANEWHYQWGDTPAITPQGDIASSTCPFALPSGVPAQRAGVGVHYNHTWVWMSAWTANLGYSPEAMSYHLCTKFEGTSTWVSTPFFPLWSAATPTNAAKTSYSATSPDYACPNDNPYSVGAFCQTRALW